MPVTFDALQLDRLLDQLVAGELAAIEYGEPDRPGGSASLLRIRFAQGHGQAGFVVRGLRFGAEGREPGCCFRTRAQLKAALAQSLDRHKAYASRVGVLRHRAGLSRVGAEDLPQFFGLTGNPAGWAPQPEAVYA